MSNGSGDRAQWNDGLSRRRFIGVAGAVGSAAALGVTNVNPAAAGTRVRSGGPSATVSGQWGATVFPTSTQTFESALSAFESETGTTVTTFKIYNLPSYMSVVDIKRNKYMAHCIKNPGVRAVCCFKPAVDGTDAKKLMKTYANMITAELKNVAVVFYQEWQNQHLTDPQKPDLTPAQIIRNVYGSYYAGVKASFPGKCAYDNAGRSGVSSWKKGDPYPNCDIYAIDIYATDYFANSANHPTGIAELAHLRGKPWGLYEMGASVGSEKPPSISNTQKFIEHCTTLVSKDLDAGLPVDCCMWYYQPKKNTHNAPGPFVTQIQALAKALTNP